MTSRRRARTQQTDERLGARGTARAPSPDFARMLGSGVRRHAVAVVLGLVATHLLLAWLSFMPTPHTGGDNAAYIALGRSLLEGSYRNIYDPLAPPHTQYPPVFPGILALAMAVGLQPWVPLKVLMLGFSAAAVAFTFLWIRRRGRPLVALAVGLLLAIAPGVLELGHWILSDVPFWAFTMFALWAFERLPRGDRRRLIVAIVATTLAYFTRSAGLPLVIGAFAWLALRRRWTQLAAFAAVFAPLALLWWLRSRAGTGLDYAGQFWAVDPYDPSLGTIGPAELVGRIGENLSKYVRLHLPILLLGGAGAASLLLSAGTLLLALAGWVRRIVRRRIGVAELFLPLYAGLLLVWPAVWSGERFLLPILPLLLVYAWAAAAWLASRVRPVARPIAGALATAGIALWMVPGIQAQVQVGSQCTMFYRMGDPYACLTPEWRDYFDVAEWAEERLPADAVVVTRKPRLWYGLSDLRALIYPFTTDATAFFGEVERTGARYVVLDYVAGTTQTYVAPILLRRTAGFCLMHATRMGTAVLGILPGAADLPETEPPQTPTFPLCPVEFWRDPADREAAMQRYGVTQ